MNRNDILSYARRKFMGELGMNSEQFYGVMGSVMGESGAALDPSAFNPSDPNGGAHGIFQYVGPRWDGVVKLAQDTGRDPTDPTVQIDYAAMELQGAESRALNTVLKSGDRYAAARAWTDNFERPSAASAHHDLRSQNADHVASLFTSGQIQDNGMSNFTTSASNAQDPNNPLSILSSISNSLTRPGPQTLDPNGKFTTEQTLGIMASMYSDPELGAQFAVGLLGAPGINAPDITLAQSLAMGVGNYLGGVPGAMAGAAIEELIRGIFNPAASPGQSSITPSVQNIGATTPGETKGVVAPGTPTSVTGAAQSQGPTTQSAQPDTVPAGDQFGLKGLFSGLGSILGF